MDRLVTMKFFQIFIISTLISYIILLSVASDISIIHYMNFKSNNIEEKKQNLQLETKIENLTTEIEQLQNQEQVLDLAFELGYVNTGDKVNYIDNNINYEINHNYNPEIPKNAVLKKTRFSNWKNYQFFLLAIPIGIAISLCYLLISNKRRE
ncbi:MAG: hypothetical protein EOL97_01050 [Spirochaetia bacterium]|nr:hypothetical protein [Spirochaetia bacterium]